MAKQAGSLLELIPAMFGAVEIQTLRHEQFYKNAAYLLVTYRRNNFTFSFRVPILPWLGKIKCVIFGHAWKREDVLTPDGKKTGYEKLDCRWCPELRHERHGSQ